MNNKVIASDSKNIEIVRLLQKNPRMSIAELARKIGMSNPAAKERVLRLEKSGLIAGYRLEVDPKAFGHAITGEDCFILKVHLPEIASLDRVLDRFLAHGQTTTSIVQSSPVPPRSPPLPNASARGGAKRP